MDLLNSDHVRALTDTKATMVQQQRNCVFYVVRADMLYFGQFGATSQLQECSFNGQLVCEEKT
jgi:hypothetical protein